MFKLQNGYTSNFVIECSKNVSIFKLTIHMKQCEHGNTGSRCTTPEFRFSAFLVVGLLFQKLCTELKFGCKC